MPGRSFGRAKARSGGALGDRRPGRHGPSPQVHRLPGNVLQRDLPRGLRHHAGPEVRQPPSVDHVRNRQGVAFVRGLHGQGRRRHRRGIGLVEAVRRGRGGGRETPPRAGPGRWRAL